MMRIIRIIGLLAMFIFVSLRVNAQGKWQIGAKAGVIGVPYQLSDNRLGAGIRLGLFLAPEMTGKINLSFSTDYRKVDNLVMEKLEHQVVVLPDGQYRSSKYLSNSGFASISLGIRCDLEVKKIRSGRLKMYVEGHAERLTIVRTVQETRINSSSLVSVLTDSRWSGVGYRRGQDSAAIDVISTDVGNVVFVAGTGMVYEFASGPQIMGGIHLDLNTRFSTFAGSSDATLTQVQVGFNYPFRTKLN